MNQYIFLFFLCFSNSTFGCSCNCFPIDIPLNDIGLNLVKLKPIATKMIDVDSNMVQEVPIETKMIFLGTLKKTEKIGWYIKMTFEVQHYYKGNSKSIIEILTSSGDCGFRTKEESKCLIFAYELDNKYYTSSSECCRSVSKSSEFKKYNHYKRFLDIISKKLDGEYKFFRLKDTYSCRNAFIENKDTLALKFEIKDNKFHGDWLLRDSYGDILEKGMYKNGKRHGSWFVSLKNGSSKFRYVNDKIIQSKEVKHYYEIGNIEPYVYLNKKITILNRKIKIVKTYSEIGELISTKKIKIKDSR